MIRKRNCKCCGKPFETQQIATKYCSKECARDGRLDMKRKRERELRQMEKAKSNTLVDIAVEARNAGMTYGQYVAAMKL